MLSLTWGITVRAGGGRWGVGKAFEFVFGPDQAVHELGFFLTPEPAAFGQGTVGLQQGRKEIHTPDGVLKVLFVSA